MHSGNSCRSFFFFSSICLTVFFAADFSAQSQISSSSNEIRSFELMSSEEAHLTLDTPSGQTFQFWISTNLNEWVPAGPLSPVGNADTTATYRVDIYPERPNAMFQVEYLPIPDNPEPIAQLAAPENEPVIQHLPDMGTPRENEADEISTVNNFPVSRAHLLVHFKNSTTVSEINSLMTAENLSLAGAIPNMQLGVLRRNVVGDMTEMHALVERLKGTDLFNAVAMNIGMSRPRTVSEPQPQLNSVGRQRGHLNWSWEWSPLGQGFGGNNAFEMSRIPQLWNWLDYGHRQKEFLGGHEVAVVESAYNPHQDLDTNVFLSPSFDGSLDQDDLDHGIAVLGIIAAKHSNRGIDGVTPLADAVRGEVWWLNGTTTNSWASVDLRLLRSLLRSATPPKVINISAGVPWYRIGHPTNTTHVSGISYAAWINDLGTLYACSFESLNQTLSNTDYLIVCSAGNDDGVNAVYNSPMANIACRPDLQAMAPQFITVENIREDRTPNEESNYDKSGVGHSVSAGGTSMTLLHGPSNSTFDTGSGTSYAAPLVSGLASFLWTLAPSLTVQEMKSLLLGDNTTFEVQGGARGNLVDGFSAALQIDRLRLSLDLRRALVDVDDGTLDGNLREEIIHYSEDPDQIHTFDGRRGDGLVNMKDFRVFRDAWLHVIGEAEGLDGPPAHFKRDLNFDGMVFDQPVSPPHPEPYRIRSDAGETLLEMIYSRYDFNGNGLLDLENQTNNPPPESLAPFGVDPDTEFDRRSVSQGILRDIDVLLNKNLWEQGEENVVLNGAPPYPDTLPFDWTTNNFSTLYVTYLQSFDIHVDMEGGDPEGAADNYDEHPFYPGEEGLEIDSYFNVTKGRSGEWEGVMTIPYSDFGDFPSIWVRYRKTFGDEFHQYSFWFHPKKGEDLALALAFDDLQFYSNTREFSAFYAGDTGPFSEEAIGKRPGAGIYGSVLIPYADYTLKEADDQARELAIGALAGRLKFPVALNGSPAFEAIYKTRQEEAGVLVEVYGIKALYNEIVGTAITP